MGIFLREYFFNSGFLFFIRLENDKLKQQLKKKDEEVVQTRATLERFANAVSKNCIFYNFTISTQQKKNQGK